MDAMILAAGLGTRLKPWTLEHPKALVPVEGKPMLERVLDVLEKEDFDRITINVHHFAGQVYEWLEDTSASRRISVKVSDETGLLLETGGGIVHAMPLMKPGADVLVHNVDILSNADLSGLMAYHRESGNDVTLLTSGRESSRKLIYDSAGKLKGWHNLTTGEYRPVTCFREECDSEEAFSGIYVLGARAREDMARFSKENCREAFPVMDYFLSLRPEIRIGRYYSASLRILDIGKPASLERAPEFLEDLRRGL